MGGGVVGGGVMPCTRVVVRTGGLRGSNGGGGVGVVPGGAGMQVKHVAMPRAHNYPFFPCPQCGKSFRTRVTLSRHEKIHKGNAFPCPVCPKVFYQVSNVKYHVHAVHGRQYEAPNKGHGGRGGIVSGGGGQAHAQAQAAGAAVLNEFKFS